MTKQKDDIWDILAEAGCWEYYRGNIDFEQETETFRGCWHRAAKAIIDKYKEMGEK